MGKLLDHTTTLFFSFSRTFHTVFHSACTNLHFHQQRRWVLFSSHPLQPLLFADFLVMAILISVRCPVSVYLLSIRITDSMDIEFEQTRGDSEGQGSLTCCSPWGHKESDMTEQLNNKPQSPAPRVLRFLSFLTWAVTAVSQLVHVCTVGSFQTPLPSR